MSDFAHDRTSGSTDVGRGFLAELERWVATDTSGSAPALRQALLAHLRAAQREQPSMALVHQFAARALEVADSGLRRGDSPVELRTHLARSCAAERDDLVASTAAVVRQARALLTEPEAWIATLSASRAVEDAILGAHRAGLGPRTVIAEGRPRFEGRTMATALAAAGVPVWLVVD
ncbi:MAG: hypothetical protein ACRENS_14205, partial [Candidatus Eiseniibacteriota bacterium]